MGTCLSRENEKILGLFAISGGNEKKPPVALQYPVLRMYSLFTRKKLLFCGDSLECSNQRAIVEVSIQRYLPASCLKEIEATFAKEDTFLPPQLFAEYSEKSISGDFLKKTRFIKIYGILSKRLQQGSHCLF